MYQDALKPIFNDLSRPITTLRKLYGTLFSNIGSFIRILALLHRVSVTDSLPFPCYAASRYINAMDRLEKWKRSRLWYLNLFRIGNESARTPTLRPRVQRRHTEKGLEYQKEILQDSRRRLRCRMEKQMGSVDGLIKANERLESDI